MKNTLNKYKNTYPYKYPYRNKKDAEKYNRDSWGDKINDDKHKQIDDSNGDNNEFDDEFDLL